MGFWGSLANEAGKKTGKAIGNKLFGSYAADVTYNNVSGQASKSASNESYQDNTPDVYETMELETHKQNLAIEMDAHKQNLALEKEIRDIEFDDSDLQGNIKLLIKLMSMTDTWFKNREAAKLDPERAKKETEKYELARAKFDAGILMCQMIDPTNPSVIMLQNKQKEWDDKLTAEKNKQNKVVKIVLFSLLGFVVLSILLACLMA